MKSVAVIPLIESRAREVLDVLNARNQKSNRASLVPETLVTTRGSLEDTAAVARKDPANERPHVKFAAEDQVKVMTPMAPHGFESQQDGGSASRSPSPSPSVVSTPSSDMSVNTTNVAKALADKLSFWNRMSKQKFTSRQSSSIDLTPPREEESQTDSDVQGNAMTGERLSLDEMIKKGDKDPQEVLDAILAANERAPQTAEQKNSELEDKIIRECVNQYTKGGMYFSYTFGGYANLSLAHKDVLTTRRSDITRSLQHKQELLTRNRKHHTLLVDLNAIDQDQSHHHPPEGKTDVLAEPSPTLPLWRRVDRQYWWNEWLSRPFVDAGVRSDTVFPSLSSA